jgi:hypothetical protein
MLPTHQAISMRDTQALTTCVHISEATGGGPVNFSCSVRAGVAEGPPRAT